MAEKKKVIGVLGGIAAGKSTVARHFERLGCAVIEADEIAHQILDEPESKREIVRLFGTGIVNAEGRVDRKSLAGIVFSDAAALARLNTVIHPRVWAEVERRIAVYQRDSKIAAIVLDVPLLAEADRLDLCDVLVFVEAEQTRRWQRAKKSGKFDENELKKREKFQISLDKKKKLAHYILRNNSDESDLAGQVAQLFSTITGSR